MVWGCAAKTVKFLVFIVNFLAFIAGMAILIAGIVALTVPAFSEKIVKELHTLSPNTNITELRTAFYLAIAVGAIIMLLGFMGCCGAWCENQCLLCTFASIMILMLLIQLIAGILAFVYKGKIIDGLRDSLTESAKNVDVKDVCDAWNIIQQELKCCGPDGEQIVPPAPRLPACDLKCPPNSQGVKCPDAIIGGLEKNGVAVGGIAIGFMVLELAAVIFACCLCQAIKDGRHLYV